MLRITIPAVYLSVCLSVRVSVWLNLYSKHAPGMFRLQLRTQNTKYIKVTAAY